MSRLLAIAVMLLVSVWPCAADPLKKPERPLIFIPGIVGSQIWIDGKQVWGGAKSLLELEKLRIPAGPKDTHEAQTCGPGTVPGDCGLIEQIGILGPIKIDEYGGFIRYLESIGYSRSGASRNLYIFSYDWRRSSFETADALDRFIKSTPGLAGHDVDILAHSMGGLAALVYAHRFDAPKPGEDCSSPLKCRIKTMITAGTPYYGSMNAVAIPIEGWGWTSRFLAGGSDAIASTVLTWPAFYELLPTYTDCCTASGGKSMADYPSYSKLPYATGASAPPADAVQAALKRRHDLDQLAGSGWPAYITEKSAQCSDGKSRDHLYMIAGDHNDTKSQITSLGGDLSYDVRRGDGTVLLRSASMNSPNEAWLSFTSHNKIFDDANVRAKIETILLRCYFSFKDFKASDPIVDLEKASGGTVSVLIDSASAKIVQHAGGTAPSFGISASLDLSPPTDEVNAPEASFVAKVDGQEVLHGTLKYLDVKQDGSTRRFAFGLDELVLPHPGLVEVEVTFGGTVSVADEAIAF